MIQAGSNLYGVIVPHTPTLLEYELDGQNSPVITALQDLGYRMKLWGIDAVVAVSTHWQTNDQFFVDPSAFHQTVTDYSGFRSVVSYDVPGESRLAAQLIAGANADLVFSKAKQYGADHALTIPLHFIFPKKDVPVVPLSIARSPLCSLRWGRTIGRVLRQYGSKVLFLASGSLSHNLPSFWQNSQLPDYEAFDRQVMNLLASGRGMEVLNLDGKLRNRAKPEGDFRDLLMLLGVLGAQSQGIVKAYESLPGVGMGVIEFADGYGQKSFEGPFQSAISLAPGLH